MNTGATKLRIRMYRQGLGDCFLLTLNPDDQPIHILVDCGTLGTSASDVKMIDVVNQIAEDTGRHLNLLIVTHEHKDHVSGFATGRAVFDDHFQIDHVWVAWTENPDDLLAQAISRFEQDLVTALRFASDRLRANQAPIRAEALAMATTGSAMRELLTFDGDLPPAGTVLGADFAKTVHEAMSYATRRAGWPPDFLAPGQVLAPEWLPGVRCYVLGPPRSAEALSVLGEHGSAELYHLYRRRAADLAGSAPFHEAEQSLAEFRVALEAEDRQRPEAGLPFDFCYRIEASDVPARQRFFPAYDHADAGWRRIDYDWLAATEDFALQLNNLTNNTSLVLAFELIGDGRVLLFPADAQLGNWRSWEDVPFSVPTANGEAHPVKTAELLKRTVFYKVGHHASHNATRKQALEAMESDDLVAMIPVDREVAKNKHWLMPEPALYAALLKQTHGRVLRADTGWPAEKPDNIAQVDWDALRDSGSIKIEKLYIEYSLR